MEVCLKNYATHESQDNLLKIFALAQKLWPVYDAQFNIVLDAETVVFKCCAPNKEFTTEILALSHYDGMGAVKLLKSDIDHGTSCPMELSVRPEYEILDIHEVHEHQ